MTPMLQFDNLALRRGPRLLIENATLQIHPGWKVGVTGANGTGKSSLFALIRDELHADAGECRHPADWVISHVAQETPAEARAAIEYVLDGDMGLRAVESAPSQAVPERRNIAVRSFRSAVRMCSETVAAVIPRSATTSDAPHSRGHS